METQCEACRQTLKVPDGLIGKSIRCPKCKQVMTVKPPSAQSGGPSRPQVNPAAGSSASGNPAAAPSPGAAPRRVQCPHCSVRIQLPAGSTASALKCPKCQGVVRVEKPTGQSRPAPSNSTDSQSAGSQAARPSAKPSTSGGAKIKCSHCSVVIQLPANMSATALKCPKCQSVIRLKPHAAKPHSPAPAATAAPSAATAPASTPASASSAGASPAPGAMGNRDDDFFGGGGGGGQATSNNPFSADFGGGGFGAAPMGASPMGPAPMAASSPGPMQPNAAPSMAAAASYGGSQNYGASTVASSLGPGIMLCVQAVIALGVNLLGIVMTVMVMSSNQGDGSVGSGFLIFMITWTVLSIIYQGLILAGSIAMIRGGSANWGRTACIMAIIPFSGISVGILGLLTYWIALAGGIWGLVALWPRSNQTYGGSARPASASPYQANNASPANPAASGGAAAAYLATAGATAKKSDQVERNPLLGGVMIVGGAVLILAAIGMVIFVIQDMTSDDPSRRRHGKAIAGGVSMGIFGFGLIGDGIRRCAA